MVLSLDLNLVLVPKTISECLEDLSRIEDGAQKLSKIDYYVKELEDEMRKIDAFKRELPLCMLLLNDAVVRLKQEAMNNKEKKNQAVVDDFVHLKLNSCEDKVVDLKDESDISDKKSWMSSVQLWRSNNNNSHCEKLETFSEQKQKSEEEDDRSTCENPIQLSKGCGAFVPFKSVSGSGIEGCERKEEKEVVSQVTGLSLRPPLFDLGSTNLTPKGNENNPVKIQNKSQHHQNNHQQQQQPQQQPYRKQRRCWSPELHRRFVDALQQLGGSQVATPKQIRELMQVDGLTNDEVKSHLQKYRLHIRKLPAGSTAAANAMFVEQDRITDQFKQPGSPQGPLRANETAIGNSSTVDDSMELEDEEKSESTHSWNGDGGHHRTGEVDE